MDRTAGIAQMVEQLICNHQAPCSIHGAGTTFGDVAQLGEQLPCTHQVVGSIPIISTILGRLAQLVRAVVLHASGRRAGDVPLVLGTRTRWFDSNRPDHFFREVSEWPKEQH